MGYPAKWTKITNEWFGGESAEKVVMWGKLLQNNKNPKVLVVSVLFKELEKDQKRHKFHEKLPDNIRKSK